MEFKSPGLDAAYQLTEFNVGYSLILRNILYGDESGNWTGRLESDAEHSYKLADLTQSLAPLLNPDLDVLKAVRYALHHDKIEKIADDTSIFASDELLASKADREADAMPQLAEELDLNAEIVELIHTYEQRADPESRFVYALDKIDAILTIIKNNGATWKKVGVTPDRHRAKRVELRQKVGLAPELLPMFDELESFLDDHPEFFAD